MVTLTATTKNMDRTMRCKEAHTIKVVWTPNGGYRVSCQNCDWWTAVPAGERLEGWDGQSYD